METPSDNADDESLPPRPWSLTVASLATCGLGLIEARAAEDTLQRVRSSAPDLPVSFPTAVQYALWSCAQEHRRGMVALEVARMVLAAFLFLAAVRVLVRVRNSGWLWRQALAGNVAVTLAAAWYERTLLPGWNEAFARIVAVAGTIPSPTREMSILEVFRRGAQWSVWATGLLGAMFLLALRFAMRARTRELTD